MEGIANVVVGEQSLIGAARFVCEALAFAPNGFAIVRLDGSCVAVNQTLASWAAPAQASDALYGVSLLGGGSDAVASALRRAASGDSVFIDVERAPLVPDRAGPWRLHVMPFRVGAAVRGASITFEDRSDTQRLSAALDSAEQRFRSLVELTTDGVVVHRNGVVLYANAAAAQLLGRVTADALVGRRLPDLVRPDHAERVQTFLAQPGQHAVFSVRDGGGLRAYMAWGPADRSLSSVVILREHSEREPATSGPRSGSVQAQRLHGVLVCDDETRLAALTAGLLVQAGYDAVTALDVESALSALQREPQRFAILLLDVNLPPGSARDVLDRMRGRHLTTPVILTSGYSAEDIPVELMRDPLVRSYLAKPYPVERLIEVIDRVLDTASGLPG